MNLRKINTIAGGALSVFLFAACEDSAGPGSGSRAEVRADLQELAAKVRTLDPPASRLAADPEAKAGSLAKPAARSPECWNGTVDGVEITEEIDASGFYRDTTWHHTADGGLACEEGEETAYMKFSSHEKDTVTESWLRGRIDIGAPGSAFLVKLSATGKVHYFSGYDIVIRSMDAVLGRDSGDAEVSMVLGLEDDKYTVSLTLAAGADLEDAPATAVVLSGPIKKGDATVGYFEIMGDDRVVIRDADRQVVAAH